MAGYQLVLSDVSALEATTDELIITTMTAFRHKYSNISTNTKHEINTVQYATKKNSKRTFCSFMCTSKSFYSTSDLYNHQCSLEYIYPYTQDLLRRHTCEEVKINRNRTKKSRRKKRFSHKSHTGASGGGEVRRRRNGVRRRRRNREEGGGEGQSQRMWRWESGSMWAGSVPDDQQPPQLFPQLPPSDAH